jgi:TolB-like protein
MNKFAVGILALVLLVSCRSTDNGMIRQNHDAARQLVQMAGNELHPSTNMIAATFADINSLTMSSPFGRIASQQLVSGFTSQGYRFVDVLLRNSVYINQSQGEFLLSRELSEISNEHNAPVVLVGTYAVGDRNVFVTAKLIRTADGVIIASHDYAVPYTQETRALLRAPRN